MREQLHMIYVRLSIVLLPCVLRVVYAFLKISFYGATLKIIFSSAFIERKKNPMGIGFLHFFFFSRYIYTRIIMRTLYINTVARWVFNTHAPKNRTLFSYSNQQD